MDSLSLSAGLTTANLEIAVVERSMISYTRGKIIVIADYSKFGRVAEIWISMVARRYGIGNFHTCRREEFHSHQTDRCCALLFLLKVDDFSDGMDSGSDVILGIKGTDADTNRPPNLSGTQLFMQKGRTMESGATGDIVLAV